MGRPTSYEVRGGVASVTLDLPEKRNALSTEMLDSLGDDLVRAGNEPEVRVVVLTHTGTTFCAGADLSVAAATSARYDIAEILRLVQDMPKPVVARIAGQCFGGGVGIAAACDLSFGAAGAPFAFSEVRLGVAPAVISVVCLPKMRRGDAAELFLTGARFDAVKAAEVGLITRAVPEAELDAVVAKAVGQLVLGGPQALGAIKRLLATLPAMERDVAFDWARTLSAQLFAADEAEAGIAAFRERRPAPWVGPTEP